MNPFITSLSVKEQVEHLNNRVRCYIATSKIEGIGVFALKSIKKGESAYLIPEYIARTWFTVPYSRFNELDTEIADLILTRWPSVINGGMFLSPNDDVWMNSFCNHSDDPNYDQRNDVALRDIAKNEEITQNYRIQTNDERVKKAYRKLYPWLEKTPDNVSTAEKAYGFPMARIIRDTLKRLVNKR